MIMAPPTATVSDAEVDLDDADISKILILHKTVGIRRMPADKSYSKVQQEPVWAAELGLAECEVHRPRQCTRGRSYPQLSNH